MPSTNVCWGIEVGAAGIKALKLESTGEGRCRVADWALIPHPKVLSTPGIDANDAIRVSLGALTNQVELGKAAIAISVPGHSSFARFAKLPPVEPKKVKDIIKFEAAQQIPFPLEEVEWDYQTFVTPDSPEMEVGIFAITRERVAERLTMLEDVGVVPNYVVLSPIAVYNALAFDLDFATQTPGTIIVDVGTTSTDLVIATPGRMWVRTFPLGGHNFTEALVNQFQLSYQKAEKLKREAQDTKHARQVFQAMRPVFTDLAQDIQRSIGYFQSLNRDAQLTRVIGVGSTWRLPGLRKYLKQQLQLDVYRIDAWKKIGSGAALMQGDDDESAPQAVLDPTAAGAKFDDFSLEMATAYGLALHGLGMNAVGGNLMPIATVRRTMWKDKVKWFGIAAGLGVLAGGLTFINPVRAHFAAGASATDPALPGINSAISRARDLKNQADNAGVTQAGEPDLRAANLAALQEGKDTFARLLADVHSAFRAADARAKTWAQTIQVEGQTPVQVPAGPALWLTALETAYIPPSDPNASAPTRGDDGARPPQHPFVGTDDAQFPVIMVDMSFATYMPEPRRFLPDVFNAWFRANRARPDAGYEIRFLDEFVVTETKGAAASDAPGRAQADPRDPDGDRGERGERASRLGGPRGGPRPGGRPEARPPRVMGEGGSSGGGGLEGGIEEIALLKAPDEQLANITANARYIWYMVIKPPAPPADAAQGGGK
jgi:type IV pilus assembly protein PilM